MDIALKVMSLQSYGLRGLAIAQAIIDKQRVVRVGAQFSQHVFIATGIGFAETDFLAEKILRKDPVQHWLDSRMARQSVGSCQQGAADALV